MSHTLLALPTAFSSPISLIAEQTLTPAAAAVTPRNPETPYRPPRV
jgi:hypothetical protein